MSYLGTVQYSTVHFSSVQYLDVNSANYKLLVSTIFVG